MKSLPRTKKKGSMPERDVKGGGGRKMFLLKKKKKKNL